MRRSRRVTGALQTKLSRRTRRGRIQSKKKTAKPRRLRGGEQFRLPALAELTARGAQAARARDASLASPSKSTGAKFPLERRMGNPLHTRCGVVRQAQAVGSALVLPGQSTGAVLQDFPPGPQPPGQQSNALKAAPFPNRRRLPLAAGYWRGVHTLSAGRSQHIWFTTM
jgi:hypothetical protein